MDNGRDRLMTHDDKTKQYLKASITAARTVSGRDISFAPGAITVTDPLGDRHVFATKIEFPGREPMLEALDDIELRYKWQEEANFRGHGNWKIKKDGEEIVLKASKPRFASVESLFSTDPVELAKLRSLYASPDIDIAVACEGEARARATFPQSRGGRLRLRKRGKDIRMTDLRFMDIGELLSADGVALERDIPYLPLPNTVDVVLSDALAPDELTATAFMFPFFDDGDVLMAHNRRRQIEVPGGHRDPVTTAAPEVVLEHPSVAATRETDEEVGAVVEDVVPVGFLRMRTEGPKPENSRYAHPVSCQQFFAGRIVSTRDFVETDECRPPVRISHEEALSSLNARTVELYLAAREAMFPTAAAKAAPTP